MAKPNINYDRAAMILSDAVLMGDRETARKWDIHPRTIENYRARLQWDIELVAFFQKFQKLKEVAWIDDVPVAITAGIAFLKSSFAVVSPTDPDAIAAVTAAVEMLADLELTRQIIKERLGE